MIIVNSREFRDKQKAYFDLVDREQQIIVKRGNKSYIITPLDEIDSVSTNAELIEKVAKAKQELAEGKGQTIDNKSDWDKLLGR